jgi:OPA family glycerol-3-phosphate transporter-like MFS transporter
LIAAGTEQSQTGREAAWKFSTVALLVAGYSGYYLCRSNLSVTMPLIIGELEHTGIDAGSARVALGTIASLGVLAYGLGKFPSGALADRLGGRRNFLSGMALSILCTVLFAVSGIIPTFTLVWMGNRLVQSLGWAGMVKIAARWFSFRAYGTVMAILSLSFLFGDALARQFMGALIAYGLGWRGVFWVCAAVLGLLMILSFAFLRESPVDAGMQEADTNPANLLQDEQASGGALQILRSFLSSKTFLLVCVVSLGTTILRETFGLWTPTYFTQATGMSVAQAAGASSLFPFFGGVSVILCGWLSDRLGRCGRAAILFSGLLVSTILLFMLAAAGVSGSKMLPVILVGILAFFIVGPYSFLAGAIALDFGGKRASGTASGLIDGVGYLGGVVSGDTMAKISVDYGWNGAFRLLGFIALVASVAAFAYWFRERQALGRRSSIA